MKERCWGGKLTSTEGNILRTELCFLPAVGLFAVSFSVRGEKQQDISTTGGTAAARGLWVCWATENKKKAGLKKCERRVCVAAESRMPHLMRCTELCIAPSTVLWTSCETVSESVLCKHPAQHDTVFSPRQSCERLHCFLLTVLMAVFEIFFSAGEVKHKQQTNTKTISPSVRWSPVLLFRMQLETFPQSCRSFLGDDVTLTSVPATNTEDDFCVLFCVYYYLNRQTAECEMFLTNMPRPVWSTWFKYNSHVSQVKLKTELTMLNEFISHQLVHVSDE